MLDLNRTSSVFLADVDTMITLDLGLISAGRGSGDRLADRRFEGALCQVKQFTVVKMNFCQI